MRLPVGNLPVTECGHPEESIFESAQVLGEAEVEPALHHHALDAVEAHWERDLDAEIFRRQAAGRNVDESSRRLAVGARDGEQDEGEADREFQGTISVNTGQFSTGEALESTAAARSCTTRNARRTRSFGTLRGIR